VTFVAGPQSMDVVLEVDKRGGMFTSGRDVYGRLRVDYATLASTDWAGQIDAWLRGVLERRPAGLGGYGAPAGYGHGTGHGYGKGHGHGRRGYGSGMGGVVAGAGAGFLGGMLAGEAFGDAFGGDDGGDGGE
jgi:sporulation-control protein